MTTIFKATANGGQGLEFVLSDATIDRYGDIVEPAGWDLKNFRRNPIALFAHDSRMPIGIWTNIRIEGGKLIARLQLAARGTSQKLDELISLVEQGVLRAVSVGFIPRKREPINPEKPYAGTRFLEQELLETSLVSVPANPAALALAKSLNVSDETMTLAFGEHAGVRRDMAPGEHAPTPPHHPKDQIMTTLAERIVGAQTDLNAKRDRLAELTQAETLDIEAVEAQTELVDLAERTFAALKGSEAKIGAGAAPVGMQPAPSVNRHPLGFRQKEVNGLDLLVRKALVTGVSHFSGKSVDKVLEERYPGHEATATIVKADQTIGTTGVAGWAAELMQTSYQSFNDALRGKSIYPALRDLGMPLNFDQAGTAYIPGLTSGGANGSFFGEGSPMRVGRITTNSTTMTSKKMGVIIPFSREAAKRSTPSLEQLVRRAIVADTAATLDSILLDATAADSIRPAGLLNGVSAAASGYGGGDWQAVVEDINTLIAPFDTANASDGLVLIMHPQQARRLSMMAGPDGTFGWANEFLSEFTVVRSTYATAKRLIAVRASDLATVQGDVPQFEISTQATIHMEDSTPLEIVSGTGPTTADPVRSFFQTDTVGVRMVMDVSWKMLRSGMVQWINTTTW